METTSEKAIKGIFVPASYCGVKEDLRNKEGLSCSFNRKKLDMLYDVSGMICHNGDVLASVN